MAVAADSAAIQFRLLNRRKGPAVQGPRVQVDRGLYKRAVRSALGNYNNLQLIEGVCGQIITHRAQVSGVRLDDGREFFCSALILTTGTFLNGVIHRGQERLSGGRIGDPASLELSDQLKRLGFQVRRLKTGTPPRLDGWTINYSELEPQWGDEQPSFLSFLTSSVANPQAPCFITRTTPATHDLVRENIARSAVYSGAISGSGPRYCPSLEDKVVRFGEREGHQIFLEPEEFGGRRVYPNGISTSLPAEVQDQIIRSIPGLRKAKILQHGYAIEYDYIDPTELTPDLMSTRLPGLFLAGQINGTTGYEEAGGQGIASGIGAALYVSGKTRNVFGRSNSYIGVMIADLVTKGVTEPYRMFTSRAEFRLSLRADNADERLTPLGMLLGIVGPERTGNYSKRCAHLRQVREILSSSFLWSSDLEAKGIPIVGSRIRLSAFEWLARAEVSLEDIKSVLPQIPLGDTVVFDRINADAKYSFYVKRQQKDMDRQKDDEALEVPRSLDFDNVAGLSNEVKSRLRASRPLTISQASRMEGITPAALMLLTVHAKRARNSVRSLNGDVSRETETTGMNDYDAGAH